MNIKPMKEVEEFLAPVAQSVGAELLEAVWNNRERSLTLVIDAPGGVDLNLCEAFHRAADVALDELDPTYGAAYTLNCSSPGLDRPFKSARDSSGIWAKRSRCTCTRPMPARSITRARSPRSKTARWCLRRNVANCAFPLTRPPRSVCSLKCDACGR